MRTLTVLSVLQTICLLFLVINAIAGREDASSSTTTLDPIPRSTRGVETPAPATPVTPTLDEALIRRVIREELEYSLADRDVGRRVEPAEAQESRDATADRNQLDYVEKQLSYYESLGTITNEEMNALHGEIGKLNPADRRAVLSRLVQALNSGAIEGQL